MSVPSVILSQIDGALGVIPPGFGDTEAIVGPADSGLVATPIGFGTAEAVIKYFGGGPLVEKAAYSIRKTGKPAVCVRTAASTAGDCGVIDVSGVNGTSVVSFDADAQCNDEYELSIVVVDGGTAGTAGISLVAGRNVPNDFAAYLDRFDHFNQLPRKQARRQFGWDDKLKSFLIGPACIGSDSYVLHSENPTASKLATWLSPSGKPELWHKTAETMIEASPVAALVLAASLASPMLRPFGWAPIGLALSSLGGGGKSTLLRFGASAWGFHGDSASRQAAGLVGNGNSTMLALLGQFTSQADLPHFVDELRANVVDQRGRHELETSLHQLIDGVERARMKRDGSGPRNVHQAVGCAVIATETDVSEFLIKGGAVRRFMPAPAPYASQPLGQFIEPLCKSYGHAGKALVSALVSSTAEQRTALSSRRQTHLEQLREGLDGANETLRTWSDQVAVALAAADAACQLIPDLVPDHELWTNQIVSCWQGLRDTGSQTTGSQADTVRRAYDLTVSWIGTMRAHLRPSPVVGRVLARMPEEDRLRRLQHLREPIIGRVFEAKHEGTEDEHLHAVDIVQSALKKYLADHGHSIGTMTTEWSNRGWLVRRSGRRGFGVNAKFELECYRISLPAEESF